jgi:hypothetical protein
MRMQFLFLFFSVFALYAQSPDSREVRAPGRSGVLESPIAFLAVGANWPAGSGAQIMVRASSDGVQWSRWMRLRSASDTCDATATPRDSSPLAFFENWDSRFLEYQIGPSTNDVKFVFVDPGHTPKRKLDKIRNAARRPAATATKPDYISRIDWGSPDGDKARGTLSYSTVTHLIVHHSADGFTGTDYPAWVRAIWRYHVFNNGWVDFGYNWAIDPGGNLYEGRAGGDNVAGAHFSCQNSGTMGVVMLGTFTNALPTEEAMKTLTRLLAWKAGQREIDPLGRSLHRGMNAVIDHISGHRDGNRLPGSCTVTQCPGDKLYPALAQVRQSVAQELAAAKQELFFSEDFENTELPGWKADGQWRWWDGMAWFGIPESKTYETGSGTLESPEFTLASDALVSFRSWHDTETERLDFDRKFVEFRVEDGEWQTLAEILGQPREWTTREFKLSARGKVRLRFRFDTVDNQNNEVYEGWYIDGLRVVYR